MKKTFGKRFISGMTSAALAASFVFGAFPGVSSVLMTSSAEAVTGFERDNTDNSLSAQNTNAKINFKGASGESVSVTTSDNTYYLLVHAQGKDSDLFGVTFKYFEEGESKDAYDLIEINAEGTDWTSPAFSLWQTRVSAAELWGSWTEREIVPDIVTMDGTFLKNSDPSKDLTLSDAIGGRNCTVVDNIDGMELTDAGYSGYSSYGGTFYFDAVGGKISPAKYSVELSFDAPTTITEDDNIYLLIESDTSSTDYKYVLEKLTVNGERSKNIDITDWYDSNGNSPEGGEYYDGSATKVTLLRSSVSDLSINNAVNRSNCGEIANGGFFNGSSVKYGRQTKVDADIPEYTEHISFTKASSVTGYNFRSILGEGLYYGMVIDRFEQGNHTESNYAVNFYEGNGQPNTPDISGKFGGHFYFAEFVHFNDEINDYAEPSDYVNFDSKDFSIDPDGTFFIDNTAACCEDGAVLHFDSEDRMKETMDRDGIARKFEDKTTINGVIDPILKNMQAVSNELAGLPVNAAPTIMGGKAYISGAGYDDDAILVIDGDAIAPYIAESGKVHIELKGDQMVIFNFDEVTEARIDEFNFRRIGDADYQLSTTPSNENTLEHGKNYWLDQNATRNIVWNLKSVKALDINKATGIFLIPDEDSVTRIKGTSSGWLESAGYVNNPDGEWHFLYTDLPRNTTVVSVDKKDITGQEEVEGAQLKLYTADGEKMFSWESDGTTHKFRLAPGDYVLEETGDEFEDDGVIYKVIPSKVTFTVVADADETSYDCTIENVKGVESSIDEDSDTGYCLYNGNAKKFTVCDAEAVDTTKIIINKYDLTGQKEVANAKLKLTGTDSRGNAVSETWTSKSGKTWEVELADGEYTLEETGTSFTDTDGTVYEIIPSALTFSIVEGKIRSAASADAAVVSLNRTSDDGYYAVGEDAASGSTLIKVCDAQKIGTTDVTLRKTDITGETEVRFAKLEIFDEEGNMVDSWISDGREHVIEGLVNGTYTLTEEAADEKKIIDDYGNEYDVVKSTVTFTVNNGKLTAVKENRADAVTTPKTGATESYVMADKSNNIITVCDAIKDAVIKRDVTINKTDITGEKEVKGAQLDLRVKGLEDDQINAIINANANNTTLNNWETYMDAKYFVMTWVSGEEAAQINGLVPGTYTLTETGDAFVYDGVTYEVMDSEVIFIIEDNGNISFDTVPAPGDERNPENSSEGYAKANGNTITICDASRSDITVSKKDITASEEVVGAHLVIKDRAGEVIEEWDSNGRDHIVKGLTNGTYILTETAVDSAKAGAEYEIIPSNVTFTVNNGKITDVNSSVLADSSDNNFDEGYVLCDEDSNTITVCDAKKKTTKVTITKTDITGTAEITGAVLTIKDSTGKNVTGTPWTSGRNGKELEVELIDGTYTLTETGTNIVDENGNEYDVIDSSLTFKVENGKVTEVTNETNNNSGEGFYEVDSDTNTITVNDAQKKTKVTINKFDITGSEELEGAVLTIKDSTGKTIGGTPWTSQKDKTLEVELENGTYTLTETGDTITDSEGNEYDVIDSTLTFKVENGKVTVVENSTDKDSGEGFFDVDSDTNTITVNDAQKKTKVTINKFDITGSEELEGAVLTIKDSTGKTIGGTPWTSQKDKTLEVELENGTYTLTETGDTITDSDGNEYDVIDSTLTFKVENGKVTVVTNETNNNNGEGFFDVDSDTNTITVNDAQKKTKVTINKFDITGSEELEGAVLTIKDSTGKTIGGTPWTSQKDKTLVVELENGTYTLTETGDTITDSEGNEYDVIDSSLTFKVENGKVTVVENSTDKDSGEGFYEVDSDTNTITVNDAQKKTKVTINKFDITGSEELEGAILTIKDSNGKTVTGTPWTSQKDKTLEVELENGTYTLTETGDTITDAEGNEYDVIDSSLTFKVENGKVTVVENSTDKDSGEGFYEVDSDTNTITVNDAKKVNTTKVTITKTDITGTAEITGAVLTVVDSDGNTVTGTPWTSGQDGKVLELELENGTYTLTETGDTITDSEGNEYDVIDSTLTFKVENGKVTVVENSTDKDSGEGFFDVDSDTNTITVNDAQKKTKVTINKFDITGSEELEGAILTIKDSNGKTIGGTPWTSQKDKTLVVELENGTYTLTETGDTITDSEGNEYDVIDSSLTFKVENGKVTVVENSTDKDSGEGFYEVDSDTNTITVNDAQKAATTTTKVTITKTDITGTAEITGAVLTVVDSDGNTVTGTPWTSGQDGKVLELELEDGTYTLTETGDTITDSEGNEYDVIDSSLTFKVENGKVTVVENSTDKDSGEGFFDVDSDTNTITVNDAKKTDDSSSKPNPDTDSSERGGEGPEDSSEEESQSDSSSSESSSSADSSSSSAADSSSKASSVTTSTASSTGNPNTGARVLVNTAEFAAAVALCFIAIKRRKNDDNDDQ